MFLFICIIVAEQWFEKYCEKRAISQKLVIFSKVQLCIWSSIAPRLIRTRLHLVYSCLFVTPSLSESTSSLTVQQPLLFHPSLKMPRCLLLSQLTLEELLLRTGVQGFTPFQDPRLWHSTAMQYLMCGTLHLLCAQVHNVQLNRACIVSGAYSSFPLVLKHQ